MIRSRFGAFTPARVVAGDHEAISTGADARFASRLHWGLVAEIAEPAMEDRVRFLLAKTACQGYELPEEVLQYLADRRHIAGRQGVTDQIEDAEVDLQRRITDTVVRNQSLYKITADVAGAQRADSRSDRKVAAAQVDKLRRCR